MWGEEYWAHWDKKVRGRFVFPVDLVVIFSDAAEC